MTWPWRHGSVQYISRNMHTVFALLCFAVVIHWLIFPYPSGLLHWHCGNLTIAPVPAKQPRWTWIKTSCEFIMNDCITTTKQSTTKPCAYFLGYTLSGVTPTQNKSDHKRCANTMTWWTDLHIANRYIHCQENRLDPVNIFRGDFEETYIKMSHNKAVYHCVIQAKDADFCRPYIIFIVTNIAEKWDIHGLWLILQCRDRLIVCFKFIIVCILIPCVHLAQTNIEFQNQKFWWYKIFYYNLYTKIRC